MSVGVVVSTTADLIPPEVIAEIWNTHRIKSLYLEAKQHEKKSLVTRQQAKCGRFAHNFRSSVPECRKKARITALFDSRRECLSK
jgi:hypothetical protein